MKLSTFYFLLLLVMPIACSSNSEKEQMLTTQQMLTSGAWTSVRDFEDLDLNGTFVEFGDECEKDNPWTFQTDGILKQSYGPVLCDPDEDDPNTVITSNWQLIDNDQYLLIEFEFDELKCLINSVTEHELVLSEVNPSNPSVYTHRIVLNR